MLHREIVRSLETARGLPHHRLVLALRHLVNAKAERLGDPHAMLGLLIGRARVSDSGEPMRNSPGSMPTSCMPIELVKGFAGTEATVAGAGAAATRKPRTLLRLSGVPKPRAAGRQYLGKPFQLPPRMTRNEALDGARRVRRRREA